MHMMVWKLSSEVKHPSKYTHAVKRVNIIGLCMPLIKDGDDVADLIVSTALKRGVEIRDMDILVVAQKVISKSEGRVVEIEKVKPSEKALKISEVTGKDPRIVELVLRESKRVLKISPETIIVQDKRDIVNINAGLDKSNIKGANHYALLPIDPDESARRLQSRIIDLTGKRVGVIISDTYSRPFRRGQVNFAIGIAGIEPFIDYRGTEDLFGYIMQVKFSAVADELASAAELVMGQGREGIPAVIIRGLNLDFSEKSSFNDLIIKDEEDLFKDAL